MRTHKRPSHVFPATLPHGMVPDPTAADLDPTNPLQALDEAQDFHVEPLDVNAMPEAERDDEMDAAVSLAESDEDHDEEPEQELPEDELTDEERTAKAADVGELYGVHIPPAASPERGAEPDYGEYVENTLGENWLETLGAEATEGGPVAEHEVDPNDDSDRHLHHATESGDEPVADKGSGGPAGL